jgi:CRISPR type III-B/RAMP module RAMP protein Cmr6
MPPVYLPSDTASALGNLQVESRSLLVDRYAEPGLQEHSKSFHEKVVKRTLVKHEQDIRLARLKALSALTQGRTNAVTLHAKLQARLLLNMAGGVMENAGLCLDRFGGFPIIPGSAVKGCARRMAVQSIVDLREEKKTDKEIAEALVGLCWVFGWVSSDWSDASDKSDLAYATGDRWPAVKALAQRELGARRDCAGLVSFLTAVPSELPPHDLELDVLTCHHRKYYQGQKDIAHDDENPIPVSFPAVAPGAVFTFVLLPLRNCPDGLMEKAKVWLTDGLQTFGLGAKTAAGYGWFAVLGPPPPPPSDFDDQSFRIKIIERLSKPQEHQMLKSELPKLEDPKNAVWRSALTSYLALPESKSLRKDLKKRTWFPADLLPAGPS